MLSTQDVKLCMSTVSAILSFYVYFSALFVDFFKIILHFVHKHVIGCAVHAKGDLRLNITHLRVTLKSKESFCVCLAEPCKAEQLI